MFIGLLIASVIAYGLQNVLMAGLFRRYDLLTMVTARGIGLLLVMAPLVLFADAAAWQSLLGQWPALALACLMATLANFCQANAVRHLPMGVAYALLLVASTLLQVVYGLTVLDEQPGTTALLMAASVIGCTVALALISGRATQLPNARPAIGLFCCLAFGLTMATALGALFHVANAEQSQPLLVAWAWEGGIGLCSLLILGLRQGLRPRTPGMPLRTWAKAALFAAPTLIGTGAYTYAVTLGPLSIAAAIIATIMVSSAIFALLIHREGLRPAQWILIVITTLAVIGLELSRERPVEHDQAAIAPE